MARTTARTSSVGLVAAAWLSASCASPPPPVVAELKSELAQLEKETNARKYASVELYDARKSVERLEKAAERGHEDATDRRAYVARRTIEIARIAGAAGALEANLEKLGEKRDEMQLRAREREAELRADEAARARARAEQAQYERDSALERARRLEERIGDLETSQTERGLVLTMPDVLFGVDEDRLLSGAEASLTQVAEFLNEYRERPVVIEGHTDSTGPDAYNQELSKRRAGAVAAFFRDLGVSPSRIRVTGHGEAKPVAPNSTAAGRQQNRRVEIVLESPSSRGDRS